MDAEATTAPGPAIAEPIAGMNAYEGMFVLHNRDTGDEQPVPPEEVVAKLIERAGGVQAHSLVWANRKLAYAIAGNQTGTYVLAWFQGGAAVCSELNRGVKLSDRCIRHLVIALDALPTTDALPGPLTDPGARPTRRAGEGEEEVVEGEAPRGDRGDRDRGDRGGRDGRGDRSDRADRFDAPDMGGEDRDRKPWESINYKNVHLLRRYVTSQGKLFSRVRSNFHGKSQRELRRAVLRARAVALLPFVAR